MNPALRQQYETMINQTIAGEDTSATLSSIIDLKMRAIAKHINVPLDVHPYVDAHRGIEPPPPAATA